MARALRTASTISAIEERIDNGFNRVDSAMEHLFSAVTKLTEATAKQDIILNSLTESRAVSRNAVKWFSGILAAIVVAIVVQFLTRK